MNSTAVLLVGEKDDKYIIPLTSFSIGIKEGQWLQIDVTHNRESSATVDQTEHPKELRRMTGN
jgi:hypothetical protein